VEDIRGQITRKKGQGARKGERQNKNNVGFNYCTLHRCLYLTRGGAQELFRVTKGREGKIFGNTFSTRKSAKCKYTPSKSTAWLSFPL
jgi:hypothetical protein